MTTKTTSTTKGETYNVRAQRWERGWELHIEGVGVTQVRKLADAEAMVRDYIRLDRGAKAAKAARVVIAKHVDEQTDAEVAEVKRLRRELVQLQERVARKSREVVTRLRTKDMTVGEVAAVLEVTPQRVSQLAPVSRARTASGSRSGRVKPRSAVSGRSTHRNATSGRATRSSATSGEIGGGSSRVGIKKAPVSGGTKSARTEAR